MPLDAGLLNRRLTFLEKTTTRDDAGGQQVDWKAIMTVWGSREDIGGREAIRGGQLAAEIDVRFTIRKPARSIDAKMRVRERGQEFDIKRIAALDLDGYEIMASSLDETGATP